MTDAKDEDLRRVAMQIAIQLPPGVNEAISVLRYAERLLEFLAGDRVPAGVAK